MLKILYAASNNNGSLIQLLRFIKAVEGKPYLIKIAAYKKSTPRDVAIDWTLDSLLHLCRPGEFTHNNNFSIYYQQIKNFKPDLVISDLEYFSSHIALELNIPLWQCSSPLINSGISIKEKNKLGLGRIFINLITSDNITNKNYRDYLINNSDKNLIYSHLGDLVKPPEILNNFEWVRPYFFLGEEAKPCHHKLITATMENNKRLLNLANRYDDSIIFSHFDEKYVKVIGKNIEDEDEYICNLHNSELFVCEGQTGFLADAFYNERYAIILQNVDEMEYLINAAFTKKEKIGKIIYEIDEDIEKYRNRKIKNQFNPQIKFIHQKIDDIYR